MLRVGLTGGIGSGKSTVSRVFAGLGARVVDADVVARDVVRPGTPALARLARTFGPGVVAADGSLDRARLGALVFADAGRRRLLEGILHPLILSETDRRLEQIGRADPVAVAVVDAALLYEVGREGAFDAVVVVWATPEQQLERLMRREGFDEAEARRRIAAQMPLEEKRRRADFVVDNSGTPEAGRAGAERVFGELRRLAAGRGAA